MTLTRNQYLKYTRVIFKFSFIFFTQEARQKTNYTTEIHTVSSFMNKHNRNSPHLISNTKEYPVKIKVKL
jgi:hypothetical protein